ncbi:hypothetical protein TNCV_4353201 [Trichonephila clavipes]|nr:hypothetical protein TNCV_4353201 [Trichonephila clavipes]
MEAHAIHRGKGLEVRMSLALSTIQVTVRFSSAKFPEGTIDGATTSIFTSTISAWTEGEGNILQSLRSRLSPQDFGPTNLTSTYSVCTRRVFGGIGHRAQAFRSGVRCYSRPDSDY